MKTHLFRFILAAVGAILFTLSVSAQTQPGQIKVAKVENEVSKVADGTSVALKNGDLLTESDVVVTGKNSSVVLVFMNGSSIKLGADSKLAVDEFKMDPLADDINMGDFSDRSKGEPTVSKTSLNLAYGEMVGDVKKLNKSSSYSIKTPVGAAGIRGTIYRIVYKPSSDGKAFFTVSTAEGLVVMTGVTEAEIPVAVDKEVVVEIDVPDAGAPAGTPVKEPVIITQDIPAETKTVITAASVAIAETVAVASFTAPTSSTTDTKQEEKKEEETKTEENKTEETSQPETKTETKTEPTPPPKTVTPPATLTPGAGGTS